MNPAPPPSNAPAPVSQWRWGVCVLLMLATVLNYMDRLTLNQLATRIKFSLGLDNYEYSLVESVFSLAFAFGAVCTGFVIDRVGVRWVYPLMVLGWSGAAFLTGYANGFMMLLICRMLLGLFESGNWPCGIKTTRTILKPEERSFGNALFQSGTALGAVITPLAVLFLIRWADPTEPFRHAVISVTGGSYAAVTNAPTDSWRVPFRVIGSLGVLWVVLWFVMVPKKMLPPPQSGDSPAAPSDGVARFAAIFRDSRFWVLFAIVVAINITWHGYRTWLPLYLQEQRGYSFEEMSRFTTLYYLIADIGSWTVGLGTLLMCRKGVGVHAARTVAFAICAVLALTTIAVPFLPDGLQLQAALLVVAFAALGMFPTYFALSQEISGKHQGKVTGTLGAMTHFSLAAIYPVEGILVETSGTYEVVLGAIGVAPLLSLGLLLWLWPRERKAEPTATPPYPGPSA